MVITVGWLINVTVTSFNYETAFICVLVNCIYETTTQLKDRLYAILLSFIRKPFKL